MRVWVTAAILSLQASLSQATDVPGAVTPSDFPPQDAELVRLGRDLFHDPVLSTGGTLACASCHAPARGAPVPPLARDTPSLVNLGAYDRGVLYRDGRLAADPDAPFGLRLPGGAVLDRPLPSVLAAQAYSALDRGIDAHAGRPAAPGSAGATTARIAALSAYAEGFASVTGPRPLAPADIAMALAAYVTESFRAIDSPFDAYLRGDRAALTEEQIRGMELFYGPAGCSTCHAGPFQTDQGFHAIGVPPRPGAEADPGRYGVTGLEEDRYRFRTPSLRNVAFTGPYGHNGAYGSLRAMVTHHLDPMAALTSYSGPDSSPGVHRVRLDSAPGAGDARLPIAAAIELAPVSLTTAEVDDLLAFLFALTDTGALTPAGGAPDQLPSGLSPGPLR